MSYKPTISVIGLNGAVGRHLLSAYRTEQYKDKIQFPIIAVTRDASTKESDSVVKYVTASTEEPSSLIQAFKGADIVIDLVGLTTSHEPIVKAAAEAGVKVYFPSEFGLDYNASIYAPIFGGKAGVVNLARSVGLKTVEVQTNLFLDYVLYDPSLLLLVDIKNGKFVKIGDGTVRVSGIFLSDLGNSLAALSVLPVSKLPDVVRISSSSLTAVGLAEIYEKASGKKLEVIPKTVKDLTDDANASIAAGMKNPAVDFITILKATVALGENDFKSNDNELVNPGESLFNWTDFYTEAEKAYSK